MATLDEIIEAEVAQLVAAACPGSAAEGRKVLAFREGESLPRALLACSYDREEPGENTPGYERRVYYRLLIVFAVKSNLGSIGDETLNAWRQKSARILYGPTLPTVPEVDDIRQVGVPAAAIPPQPFPVDTQALAYEIVTYEPVE